MWTIEKLRSETMKQHTLATGFSCAKVANLSTLLSYLTINFDCIAVTEFIVFCKSIPYCTEAILYFLHIFYLSV